MIAEFAIRLSIGLAGAAFGVWLAGVDQNQIERAHILNQDAVDAFQAAEGRRAIGDRVNTDLLLGAHIEIIREKKALFDKEFADHQKKVNQVFAAATFGLRGYTSEFKKFRVLYEDQLAECLLKPMRKNLEARYRCTIAGRQSCVQVISLDKRKCGVETASFKALNETALNCITELRAALTRLIETKVRFMGVAGRLDFVWRKLGGADTEVTIDGRSWRAALSTADERECRLTHSIAERQRRE